MLANPRIQCKSCNRVIAVISADGLVPSISADTTQICDTCQPFQAKYQALIAADAKYASFEARRENYGPKVEALFEMRRAHMMFENWLIEVDAPREEKGRQLDLARQSISPRFDAKRESSKRPRSQSPQREVSSLGASSNRSCSTVSLPERKRIKFSAAVEFRDDYRTSEHFARSEEAYTRGRHAAPEGSEYLDTSGSSKSFLQFTGFKKIGYDWVDMWQDDDSDVQTKSEKGKLKKIPKPSKSKSAPEKTGESRKSSTQADARTQRLERRRSIPPEINPVIAIENREYEFDRGGPRDLSPQAHSSKNIRDGWVLLHAMSLGKQDQNVGIGDQRNVPALDPDQHVECSDQTKGLEEAYTNEECADGDETHPENKEQNAIIPMSNPKTSV